MILIELVELSNKFLAEAMFGKLELPKPVYFVRRLEQGGYVSAVEFYPTKEHFCISAERIALSSPVCKDGVSSINHAAVRALRFMERREHKALVDFNYEQLQEEKKGICKHHKKTIKQMTGEGCEYVDEVRVASNKIHDLAGATYCFNGCL